MKSQLDLSTIEDDSTLALTNIINEEMHQSVRLTSPDPVVERTDTHMVLNLGDVDDDSDADADRDSDRDRATDTAGRGFSITLEGGQPVDKVGGAGGGVFSLEDTDDADATDGNYRFGHGTTMDSTGGYAEHPDAGDSDADSDAADLVEEVPLSVLHAQQKAQKRTLVVKIRELQQRLYDVETSPKTFTVSDSLEELQFEYERLVALRNAKSTRAWYRKILLGVTNGLEWMNHKWNPVGLKLDGWSTDLASTIDEFDDVFDELSEKYSGDGQTRMAPEMRLVALVLYSGMAYSVGQTLAAKASPDIAEIINKDPVLRERFVKVATEMQMERTLGGAAGSVMSAVRGAGDKTATTTTASPFFGKVRNAVSDIFSTERKSTINDFMASLDDPDLKVNELGL